MFTSTLHRSVLGNRIVLFGIFFAAACSANAGAELKRVVTAEEADNAKGKITQAVKSRDDFPEESLKSINLTGSLRWSAERNGKLLAPVVIRFDGISNSYCRLVSFDSLNSNATLIKVPVQANFDDCKKFHNVHYLDINADGLLDFVASAAVKSNAFDGYVDEQVVYLSDIGSDGGYCYSESASAVLHPEQMSSRAAMMQALAQEKTRLNISQFLCASES